jgi:two-component system, OmpR family, response regulator RegX3
MNILLVEDDANLALGVEYALQNEGFAISVAGTAARAAELLPQGFDLALLDVMLPDGTGYDICKLIRRQGNMPVIFLTACDEEVNIVMGLDLGGDDYITKPFRIRELISRINAVLRRMGHPGEEGGTLISGVIELNTLECRVLKNDMEASLTPLEYRLLLAFLNNPRQALGRGKLLETLWDVDGEFVDDNALSVYIRRLREKLEDDPDKPACIMTVRGIGYKWDADVRRA